MPEKPAECLAWLIIDLRDDRQGDVDGSVSMKVWELEQFEQCTDEEHGLK